MEDKKMLEEKNWQEFRESGLMFFINQILHAFGWALVVELDDESNVTKAYPARTKFRGFGKVSIDKGYKNIAKYLKGNADVLFDEAYDDGDDDEEH